MNRLIIEGVAGTGKSSVIQSLKLLPSFKDALFISEEETLGELFSELADKSISVSKHMVRLETVINKIQQSKNEDIVLERFHQSYFALGIDWQYLQAIDLILSKMHFKTVLLDLPDSEFEKRSLKRQERSVDGWEQGFIDLYGSGSSAAEAFRQSQLKRKESLKLSRLESRIIDTSEMNWHLTAQQIALFAHYKKHFSSPSQKSH